MDSNPLFDNLLEDIRVRLDSASGNVAYNILEFIDNEVRLGIELTRQQKLILKLLYGLSLDELDLSILEYWQKAGKTNWNGVVDNQSRGILCCEVGRRGGKCSDIDSAVQSVLGLTYLHEIISMPISTNSLMSTARGMMRADEVKHALENKVGQSIPINLDVAIEGKNQQATATNYYIKGESKTKLVRTACGYEINATPEHRVKIMDLQGEIDWKYIGDIKDGDYICIHRSTGLFPSEYINCSDYEFEKHPQARCLKEFNPPSYLDSDYAYLIGLLTANGTWNKSDTIEVSFHDQDLSSYENAFKKIGLTNYRIMYDKRSHHGVKIRYHSVMARHFLDLLGWKIGTTVNSKATPWSIRRSPKDIQAAYLSGLFDGDGSVEKGGSTITASTASKTLAIETQLLLLNFGIICRLKRKVINNKDYYILAIRGKRSTKRFAEQIGFRLRRKQDLLEAYCALGTRDGSDTERIPYQINWLKQIRNDLPSNLGKQPGSHHAGGKLLGTNYTQGSTNLRNLKGEFHKLVGNAIKDGSGENLSSYRLQAIINFARQHCPNHAALKHFEYIQDCDYFYDPVILVEDSSAFCVDLTVPNVEQYVSQGMTNHNSSLAAIMASYEFYSLSRMECPQKTYNISTSTPIGILILATTADQAKKYIFREVIGIIKNSPYFKRLATEGKVFIGKEEISNNEKHVFIQSGNSKSGSQVGGTLKCLIMDEVSRFEGEDGTNNAVNLWQNLGISCAPFGTSAKRIAVSSAWYEGDGIQALCKMNWDNPNALVIIGKSWDFNPIHAARDNPVVDSYYREDPIKAALECEGIRPAVADAFLNPEEITRALRGKSCIQATKYIKNNLTCLEITKLEPRRAFDTIAHIDPSVSSDGYALAFGHGFRNEDEDFCVQIDGVLLWQPSHEAEVSYIDVGEALRNIHKVRPILKVTADHYNSPETIQRLKQDGINAEVLFFSARTQLQMYDLLRQLLHSNRLILPKNNLWADILERELKQVFLHNGRKIDHPVKGSKDIADAVAAVAWELNQAFYLAESTQVVTKKENITPENSLMRPGARGKLAQDLFNTRSGLKSKLKSMRPWLY